MREEKRTRGST